MAKQNVCRQLALGGRSVHQIVYLRESDKLAYILSKARLKISIFVICGVNTLRREDIRVQKYADRIDILLPE